MQTWKSGLLKNAHRPIFHAHRCCKITLLLSQTNLEDNFDTTNLLFFRGNDPSQASFNHPLTGTCIWFLHGRCLNIWILTPSLCRCDGKSWKWWSIGQPFYLSFQYLERNEGSIKFQTFHLQKSSDFVPGAQVTLRLIRAGFIHMWYV